MSEATNPSTNEPPPRPVQKRKPRRICEFCGKSFTLKRSDRKQQRFHNLDCAKKWSGAERRRRAKAVRDAAHYINLWIDDAGTVGGSVKFYLDNEVYVRLWAWMEKRPELRNVTSAMRAMIRKTVWFDGSRTLMEAFDDWRVCNGAFKGRPEAIKWIIGQMLAKG